MTVPFGTTPLQVPRAVEEAAGPTLVVGVRPENLKVGHEGLPIVVDVVEELGADAYVYGRAEGVPVPLVARADWRNPPSKGERVHLAVSDPSGVHHFDPVSGLRLG